MAYMKWIPCSERLPEEDGQYLITVKYKHVNDSYEDIYAEHGEWYDGRWDMFCFGHCGEVEDIIAWMPLPEPYKKDTRAYNDEDAARYLLKKHSESALEELERQMKLSEALNKIRLNKTK